MLPGTPVIINRGAGSAAGDGGNMMVARYELCVVHRPIFVKDVEAYEVYSPQRNVIMMVDLQNVYFLDGRRVASAHSIIMADWNVMYDERLAVDSTWVVRPMVYRNATDGATKLASRKQIGNAIEMYRYHTGPEPSSSAPNS